jgi:hypothetical protein
MTDELSIYVIVALNIFVQLMLIHSLRFPPGGRRKYYRLAVAIPVATIVSMRLLILAGLLHARVADQSAIERFVTGAASIILMAAPWVVTALAIVNRERRAWIRKLRAESDEPV